MALPSTKSPIEEQLRPITFEEYRALPDDGPRYELINGELFISPASKAIHHYIIGRLFAAINDFVVRTEMGIVLFAPFDVRLSEHSAVQPDLLFISRENRQAFGRDFALGAPDLAIDVLSPSNRRIDLVLKRALYADNAVREYWIVDSERRTVSVNVLQKGRFEETVHTQGEVDVATIPGLSIDLSTLFDLPGWLLNPSVTDKDEPNT